VYPASGLDRRALFPYKNVGHRLDFQLAPSGEVVMKVLKGDLRALKGIVKSPRPRAVSLAGMDRAMAEGSAGE
jgi:hypothetical protein